MKGALSLSMKEFWRNPSLIGVMVLQIVFLILLGTLFGVLTLVMPTNPSLLGVVVILLVFLVQFLLFLVVRGFFSAGFYTMIKNVNQDGSTIFREFFPGAKRYWLHYTAYLFFKYLFLFVLFLPFIISFAVSPVRFELGQTLSGLQMGLLVFWLLSSMFVTFFWMFWGEAFIIYEDLSAWDAIVSSARFSHMHVAKTVKVVVYSAFVSLVALALLIGIMIPYQVYVVAPRIATDATVSGGMLALQSLVDIIAYLIIILAVVLVTLFIFKNYMMLAGKHVRKHKGKAK